MTGSKVIIFSFCLIFAVIIICSACGIISCSKLCSSSNQIAVMKASVSAMLNVLFEAAPKSVGGKLPDDAFYYGVK